MYSKTQITKLAGDTVATIIVKSKPVICAMLAVLFFYIVYDIYISKSRIASKQYRDPVGGPVGIGKVADIADLNEHKESLPMTTDYREGFGNAYDECVVGGYERDFCLRAAAQSSRRMREDVPL